MAYKQKTNPFKASTSPLKQVAKPAPKKTAVDLQVESAVASKQKADAAKLERIKRDTESQKASSSRGAEILAKNLATSKQATSDSTAVSNKLKAAGLSSKFAETMSNAKANETRISGSPYSGIAEQQVKGKDGIYKKVYVSTRPKQMKKKC